MTGLFSRKPKICALCGKEAKHTHKPKREWGVKGPLCGECHVDRMKAHYDSMTRQACASCGQTTLMRDLWEPMWQWDMDGLLCKPCFDRIDAEREARKTSCALCGGKLGLIRYNPKSRWKIDGQLCRKCWDAQKSELG